MKSKKASKVSSSRSWTRYLRSGEAGQVLIMTGFAIVVMFAIVGLAVDVGRMFAARAELGRAVDAAALAGVLELPDVTEAENTALAYLAENEPDAAPDIDGDPANNSLTVDASKTVNMMFIRVLGINTATVSAHAKAGFGVAYLDAVLVLDVTQSMVGDPITNAKEAAIDFKDTLLGSSPNGRTVIGVTPFRGCFRPLPLSNAKTECVPSSQQTALSSNSASLETLINSLTAGGGTAGTNVCTGLAAGWSILDGVGNHTTEENARRYMVLLSDGDNYYAGNYTYQAPLGVSGTSSPGGVSIDGSDYPCQPHNSCGSPWNTSPTTPCYTGTYGDLIAYDYFDSGTTAPASWSGGGGWTTSNPGAWARSGDNSVAADGGSNRARLRQTGAAHRRVDLSAYAQATLSFDRKVVNLSGSERAYVEIQQNATCSGATWTQLANYQNVSSYTATSIDISSYAGNANVCIRFRVAGSNTADIFYFDNVEVTSGASSSNGYLNGNDGSNPSTCNESPRPRERQLDVRTLDLARAIKNEGVEIFVVAFTAPTIPGCNLGSGTIWNDGDPSECNTVLDTPAGPIGNNTSDTSANVRLLKCIASSTDETSDHYFYAATADDLPMIFTQIAQQIAHRLIE